MRINLSDYDVDRVLLAIKCCMIELRLQETEPETPADEQQKLAEAQSKWNALYIDIERQKEQHKTEA